MSSGPLFAGDRRRGAAYRGPGPVPRRRRADRFDQRLSPVGVLSRVVGDAGISFLSVMAVLVVRALVVAANTSAAAGEELMASLVPGGLVLAAVFVGAVTLTNMFVGVYSRHRTYPMRTKLIRLVQSAAVAGGGAGVMLLVLSPSIEVPLSAYYGGWVLTALALPASRWWSWAYRIDVQARQVQEDMELRAASRLVNGGRDRDSVVLVIGGAGYIGSALLARLLDEGKRVRLLDVFLYGKEPIAPWLNHPLLEVVEADYRRFDKLVEAMQGVQTVVHLGGLVGDPACAWNEALTVEVNLTFTRVIAEIAKASGVERFVFASTCSVYGASDEILDEDSDMHPVSLYARSKIGSERVLEQLHTPDFAVTILRLGTIFGISGRTRFDLVVNLLTAKAHVDRRITVFGGDQWRPFVHVADAAKAVSMVLDAPHELVAGRVFNVGSDDHNATLGDVGRLINRLVPEAEYVDSGRDGDRRNYRVSFKRIRDELGFVPDWTLEDGVKQVLQALRSGRVRDYRDPMYSNVLVLTELSSPLYRATELDIARLLIAEDEVKQAPAVGTGKPGRVMVERVEPPQPLPNQLPELAQAATPGATERRAGTTPQPDLRN